MRGRHDDDLLGDLAEPEGPAQLYADEGDFGDVGDPLDADALDFEGAEFEAGDGADELEGAIAEALGAEDADEFNFGGFLKKVAPIVSQVAGAVPFIPGAGVVKTAADIVGQLAADEADEIDALDGIIDVAEEADSFDAVAPVAAGLAIRKGAPGAARLPHHQRKQLVKATAAATRHVAQRHGPAAVAAMPAIVRHARRVAAQTGAPAQQLPRLVRRTAAKVTQSPQLVRRFARTSQAMRTAPEMGGGMGPAGRGMMRRRRRGYAWDGDGGWGGPGMTPYRRRGTRWGGYGYGGGAWGGPRRITLRPGSQIIIQTM